MVESGTRYGCGGLDWLLAREVCRDSRRRRALVQDWRKPRSKSVLTAIRDRLGLVWRLDPLLTFHVDVLLTPN